MSVAMSLAPTVNGFHYDSPQFGDGTPRESLAPLLRDSTDAYERLAVTSRGPGFSLVTVSVHARVVGYGAATKASVEVPVANLPPVTVGGFTAEAVSEWAAARGRGEVMPEPTPTPALRLDPFVIGPELDSITTDQVARGLVCALLYGRSESPRSSDPESTEAACRVLVRPASPAVAVLIRAGWRAAKMSPLSPWAQFEAPGE